MANEITTALKQTAEAIVKYVNGIATMSVETTYVLVDGSTNTPQLVALTEVSLDGDSKNTVPLVKGPNGALAVDQELYEIHKTNVATAIDYRSRMMAALLSALQGLKGN